MAKRCQAPAAHRVAIAAQRSPSSRKCASSWTQVLVAAAMLASSSLSWAVSRLGQTSDDSICDIGATERGGLNALPAAEFIATKCRNGQVLIGSSSVPQLRSTTPLARRLATKYCVAEDIKSRYLFRHAYTVTVTDEHVRCVLSKLPGPVAAGALEPAAGSATGPASAPDSGLRPETTASDTSR